MRIKIDENLPEEAVGVLQRLGHEATTVRQEGLGGSNDVSIADLCRNEKRVLLTLDIGFADVRAFPPENYAGIVVLRLGRHSRSAVLAVTASLSTMLVAESVAGKLWIVEEARIRIRG